MVLAKLAREPSGKSVAVIGVVGVAFGFFPPSAFADAYTDMINAAAADVVVMGKSQLIGPSADKVGEGFKPGLTQEEFEARLQQDHAGGYGMYKSFTLAEQTRIFEEYYIKGYSYAQVLEVMQSWMESRYGAGQ
jgi:hypothetical protein